MNLLESGIYELFIPVFARATSINMKLKQGRSDVSEIGSIRNAGLYKLRPNNASVG